MVSMVRLPSFAEIISEGIRSSENGMNGYESAVSEAMSAVNDGNALQRSDYGFESENGMISLIIECILCVFVSVIGALG